MCSSPYATTARWSRGGAERASGVAHASIDEPVGERTTLADAAKDTDLGVSKLRHMHHRDDLCLFGQATSPSVTRRRGA